MDLRLASTLALTYNLILKFYRQTDEAKITSEKNGEATTASASAPSPAASPTKTESKSETASSKGKRYLYGTNSICCPREGMEMTTMMKDGMIEDWDLFENR